MERIGQTEKSSCIMITERGTSRAVEISLWQGMNEYELSEYRNVQENYNNYIKMQVSWIGVRIKKCNTLFLQRLAPLYFSTTQLTMKAYSLIVLVQLPPSGVSCPVAPDKRWYASLLYFIFYKVYEIIYAIFISFIN